MKQSNTSELHDSVDQELLSEFAQFLQQAARTVDEQRRQDLLNEMTDLAARMRSAADVYLQTAKQAADRTEALLVQAADTHRKLLTGVATSRELSQAMEDVRKQLSSVATLRELSQAMEDVRKQLTTAATADGLGFSRMRVLIGWNLALTIILTVGAIVQLLRS